MKESVFATEMRKAFLKHTKFYMKIPDSYGMQRFATVKNFDAFSVISSTPYAIEYKMQKKKGSFSFNRVRDIQVQSLKNFWESGGQALIIINFRWEKFNKVLVITIEDYIDIVEYYQEECNRKSIPWPEIEKVLIDPDGNHELTPYSFTLTRKKYEDGTFWDIGQLL